MPKALGAPVVLHRLCFDVESADVERAEAILDLCGAIAIAFVDAADEPLFEPRPGETPLWPRVTVEALFEGGIDSTMLIGTVGAQIGSASVPVVTAVQDNDWTRGLEQNVEARKIGRRIELLPATAPAASPDRIAVRLNMGLAFGTGRHPTTALCLKWLDEHDLSGATVLDYGCGSGVLAIAALRLGARRAWATDNDPQALLATRGNAALNAVAASLETVEPAQIDDIRPNIILANILADTLLEHEARFAELLPRDGSIVLSGILSEQADTIVDRYAADFASFDSATLGGWTRISARRR